MALLFWNVYLMMFIRKFVCCVCVFNTNESHDFSFKNILLKFINLPHKTLLIGIFFCLYHTCLVLLMWLIQIKGATARKKTGFSSSICNTVCWKVISTVFLSKRLDKKCSHFGLVNSCSNLGEHPRWGSKFSLSDTFSSLS